MVNVTDIIVGDWFQYIGYNNHQEYIQIENIYGTEVNCVVEDYEIIRGHRIANLKPIDITPDFLEKNGFEYMEAWNEWWHKSEDGFGSDIQLSVNEDCFTLKDVGNAVIRYVHQLQHAFHICGLDDLAVNIKML